MKVFSLVSTARRWSASASAARDVTFSLGARDILRHRVLGDFSVGWRLWEVVDRAGEGRA
jgi:hypothetical protein